MYFYFVFEMKIAEIGFYNCSSSTQFESIKSVKWMNHPETGVELETFRENT